MRPQTRGALESGHRVSVTGHSCVENQGPPRLPGRPLPTCRGHPPRRVRCLLALFAATALLPSETLTSWATRNDGLFGAVVPRPARSRTYASPVPLPTQAQGSLPACRASLWPGGFRTHRTTNRLSERNHLLPSRRTGLAWPLLAPNLPACGRQARRASGTQNREKRIRPKQRSGATGTVLRWFLNPGPRTSHG